MQLTEYLCELTGKDLYALGSSFDQQNPIQVIFAMLTDLETDLSEKSLQIPNNKFRFQQTKYFFERLFEH